MSGVAHVGAVCNLPARFHLLDLAAGELVDLLACERNQAAAALANGGKHASVHEAKMAVRKQRSAAMRLFRRVEHELLLCGTVVAGLLDAARRTESALISLELSDGTLPRRNGASDRVIDDTSEALAPLSAKERDAWKREIQAEIRRAAGSSTPRPNFLRESVASEGNGAVTDEWVKQRIRDIRPAILLASPAAGDKQVRRTKGTNRTKRSAAAGRTVCKKTHDERKLLTERFEKFKANHKSLGYSRGSVEHFTNWATDEFDDMPSDDPAIIKKMIAAHRRTPAPCKVI